MNKYINCIAFPSLILVAAYMQGAIWTIGAMSIDYYNGLDKTVISEFRERSEAHKMFALLYRKCNSDIITENLDDTCIDVASIALNQKININQVIDDFYALNIIPVEDSLGRLFFINPSIVYRTVQKKINLYN